MSLRFNQVRAYAIMRAFDGPAMLQLVIPILAIALYLALSALLVRRLRGADPVAAEPSASKTPLLLLGLSALALHTVLVYEQIALPTGLNLSLTTVISLVALAIAALYVLVALLRPVENLGIIILPIAAAAVALSAVMPSRAIVLPYGSMLLFAHIVISILAYSLLSLGIVQSLVLSVQERQLHGRQPARYMRSLPPVETMEKLMFQLIGLGFALLTLTVISGIFFSEQVFGKPLALTHHIILSIFAWLTFAILLFGRLRFGWRGRHAVRWALSGFALLVLGYFGSKFVLEVMLPSLHG